MSEIDLNYFKNLSIKEILCLARKSIQITTENRELEDKLEKIKSIVSDELNLKFDVTGKLQEIKEIIESEE